MNLEEIHLRALEPEDIEILEKVENDTDYWNYSNQTEPFSPFISSSNYQATKTRYF